MLAFQALSSWYRCQKPLLTTVDIRFITGNSMPNDESVVFSTSDYKQAATFLALGHDIIDLDKSQPQLRFVFNRTPAFKKDYSDYIKGNIRVEPQALWEKFKMVKGLLFAAKDQGIGI